MFQLNPVTRKIPTPVSHIHELRQLAFPCFFALTPSRVLFAIPFLDSSQAVRIRIIESSLLDRIFACVVPLHSGISK
jgi:hypothetical protein